MQTLSSFFYKKYYLFILVFLFASIFITLMFSVDRIVIYSDKNTEGYSASVVWTKKRISTLGDAYLEVKDNQDIRFCSLLLISSRDYVGDVENEFVSIIFDKDRIYLKSNHNYYKDSGKYKIDKINRQCISIVN